MLFSGIAEPLGAGWSAALFLRESSPCNSSVICLATALVKVRLPSTPLREIVGDAFTHENVAGVAAIHHSLRDVDAYAGDVFAPVGILDMMDRAAVDSHPYRQTRLCAQGLANLQGAFDRVFH